MSKLLTLLDTGSVDSPPDSAAAAIDHQLLRQSPLIPLHVHYIMQLQTLRHVVLSVPRWCAIARILGVFRPGYSHEVDRAQELIFKL